MRQSIQRILAIIILLACVGGLVSIMPPHLLLAWGIGCLVSLGLCCLLELKLSRLEQRSFHLRSGQLMLMPVFWPLGLADCGFRFYVLWSQPRWAAKYERQKQERIARMTATDAAMTDRRCPFCGKPCPSYRKTCKHCHKPLSAPGDSHPTVA
jgi:hypothetical protein